MDTVEQTLGGGVISAYLQGCCGDINPAGADGELILKGNDDEVTRIAKQFAGDGASRFRQAIHVTLAKAQTESAP